MIIDFSLVFYRFWLFLTLASAVACVFVVLSAVFCSFHLGAVGAVTVLALLVQLLGFMGAAGVGLSAVPAVILVLAAGMGVHFTIHVLTGFATSVGCKSRRAFLSVRHMSAPVLHGAATTFLGVAMLAASEFDFIFRYFFLVLTALVALGLFNGLVFLPVLLSSLGPPAEVIPKRREGEEDDFSADRISLPSPEPSPRPAYNTRSSSRIGNSSNSSRQKLHLKSSNRNAATPVTRLSSSRSGRYDAPQFPTPRRHDSDASLSTIAEESQSYVSSSYDQQQGCRGGCTSTSSSYNGGGGASVFVEPEVIVETTTVENGESRCSTPGANQTTRVTATAKFKVEVHAPTPSAAVERPSSRRSRRGSNRSGGGAGPSPQHSIAAVSSNSGSDSSNPPSVSSSISSTGGDLGFSEK